MHLQSSMAAEASACSLSSSFHAQCKLKPFSQLCANSSLCEIAIQSSKVPVSCRHGTSSVLQS